MYRNWKKSNICEEKESRVAGDENIGERYWSVPLQKYFSQPMQQKLEINLPDECFRLLVNGNEVWAPLYEGNVNIYSKTGELRKTINIAKPRSVEKGCNGDIFIACDDESGLHVIVGNDDPIKLCNGSFADVCSFGNKIYALNYRKESITEFCLNDEAGNTQKLKWKQGRKIQLNERDYVAASTYDTLVVTKQPLHPNLNYFYVCSRFNNIVHKFNDQGQMIQEFDEFICPRVCGADSLLHILVADANEMKYRILDPESGQYSNSWIRLQNDVFDAKIDSDGALWLVQGMENDGNFKITNFV